MKASSVWPNGSYYNIWVVSEINNNGGGSGIQGFAYFPGAAADRDGAVILHNAFGYDPGGANGYNLKSYTNLNATTVHELGHGFNLYHTFAGDMGVSGGGPSQCPAQADGCVTYNGGWQYYGDCCSDTPPHIRSSSNCNPGGTNSCDGGSSNSLFVHNFMDYSSQTCKDEFTADQKTRMRTALETTRGSLLSSKGLDPPSGAYTPPIAASCTPVTGPTGMGSNYTGIGNVMFNTINYSSGYPSQDNSTNGYLDVTTDCQSTTEVEEGQSYTLTVSILFTNSNTVKAWIDYNNNGIFEDATEMVLSSSGHNSGNPASTSVTIPTAVNNTYLRMRVMCDLGSIANSCTNPTYGQAEDYAVLIAPNPVPVELVGFTGRRVDEGVQLDWTTASELNNDFFVVQKSLDGRHFENLAIIEGKGTTLSVNDYKLIDENPFSGTNYYRLIQVDFDGTENIPADIVAVDFDELQHIHVFPNPMTGNSLYIEYITSDLDDVTIEIFDVTGRPLYSQTKFMGEGKNILELEGLNLGSGIYFLRITKNTEGKVIRFVKK